MTGALPTPDDVKRLTVLASNIWTARDNIYNRALLPGENGASAREAIWKFWKQVTVENLERALELLGDEEPARTQGIMVVRTRARQLGGATESEVMIEDARRHCSETGSHAWAIPPTANAAIAFAPRDEIRVPEDLERIPQHRTMRISCARCGELHEMSVGEYRAHWDDERVRPAVDPEQMSAIDERIAP